jgi:hypothetical protein
MIAPQNPGAFADAARNLETRVMNATPGSFWEWIALLDSGERTGLMVLSLFGIMFNVTVAFCAMYYMHKNRLDDALKRELLDRGMSADEIATVVRARPQRSCGTSDKLGEV